MKAPPPFEGDVAIESFDGGAAAASTRLLSILILFRLTRVMRL